MYEALKVAGSSQVQVSSLSSGAYAPPNQGQNDVIISRELSNIQILIQLYSNLTFDGVYSDLSFDGPIFICENNRKSNKIMHCVKKKKLFD